MRYTVVIDNGKLCLSKSFPTLLLAMVNAIAHCKGKGTAVGIYDNKLEMWLSGDFHTAN